MRHHIDALGILVRLKRRKQFSVFNPTVQRDQIEVVLNSLRQWRPVRHLDAPQPCWIRTDGWPPMVTEDRPSIKARNAVCRLFSQRADRHCG